MALRRDALGANLSPNALTSSGHNFPFGQYRDIRSKVPIFSMADVKLLNKFMKQVLSSARAHTYRYSLSLIRSVQLQQQIDWVRAFIDRCEKATREEVDALWQIYQEYCQANKLPQISADELYFCLLHQREEYEQIH